MTIGQQPALHDLTICFRAPTVVLSDQAGQIRRDGAQGVLHADVRVLSRAELTIDGAEPTPVAQAHPDAAEAAFTAVMRWLGDRIPDPRCASTGVGRSAPAG